MPRRGKRDARPGLRRHGKGWQANVRVKGVLHTKTFPLDTPDQTMAAWRESQRSTARVTQRGSLAADVVAYLATVQHMPTVAERQYHLEAWVNALGPDRVRATITTTEINAVLSTWRTSGKKGGIPLSATAVRHRRTALLHLFHRLDGKDAANTVRASWRPKDPPAQPRSLPPAVVIKILQAVTGPKTRARLWVMATTGLPHKSLMQLTPESIDKEHRRVRIPSRHKGAGAAGRWLPLSPAAFAAFAALNRVNAWGGFSPSSMWKRWTEALERLKLPHSSPYALRHSMGTLLYEETGDLATVARLLGHANERTSQRYSLSANDALDAQAMAKVGRKLPKQLPTARKTQKKRVG